MKLLFTFIDITLINGTIKDYKPPMLPNGDDINIKHEIM
jgi:hypothetical protein